MTTAEHIAAIGAYLRSIDHCMADENIPGHVRRRVLNRFCFGTPDGDPDAQMIVLRDGPPSVPHNTTGPCCPGKPDVTAPQVPTQGVPA